MILKKCILYKNKCSYITINVNSRVNMDNNKWFFCIDMKCFFASVECVERGLNPFDTPLAVVDSSRGVNAICLAISPKMKALGIKNRCRFNDIPKGISFIDAIPRMMKYIEYASRIYDVYLDYVSPDDVHVYSIDEAFIDVTAYLKTYKTTPKKFAKFLIDEIALRTGIPATCGIGTNLYLSKIALDISAKKNKDHIGFLTEELFKLTLSKHQPLTDFWGIARGTVTRLNKYAIYDMEGIRKIDPNVLYKEFGINAELLIDHAYGRENCTIQDIKNYKTKSRSISNSQILFSDYETEKAKLVLQEMTLTACQKLLKRKVIANSVSIYVGYSKDTIKPAGSSIKLKNATSSYNIISKYVDYLFDKIVVSGILIRRLGISFGGIMDESAEGYDFFTDLDSLKKERTLERTILNIKSKYGKNAILRGFDLQEGATQKERNKLIGGHNGG